MRGLIALAVQLAVLAAVALSKSSTGNSVLVVLEKELSRDDFSAFFGSLEGLSLLLLRSSFRS